VQGLVGTPAACKLRCTATANRAAYSCLSGWWTLVWLLCASTASKHGCLWEASGNRSHQQSSAVERVLHSVHKYQDIDLRQKIGDTTGQMSMTSRHL